MKQYVSDFKVNGVVDSVFSVKYKHPPKPYVKGFLFAVGLSDKTGEIELTYFGGKDLEKVQKVYDSFRIDEVIHVKGYFSEFREKRQINSEEENGIVEKAKEYDQTDFVAKLESLDAIMESIDCEIGSIKNPFLKKLMDSFFGDKDFYAAYKNSPAAMFVHHAYIGGLAHHSLHMVKICRGLEGLYELDHDLITAGCLLHDIGKIKEFEVGTNIKQSEEGMLRGHTVIGEQMVLDHVMKIQDFPSELRLKIAHIILSHHGELEYGAVVTPAFAEAVAVRYADAMDSTIEQFTSIKKNTDTEDFRVYSKRLGSIYLK